jgi:hypothetical protein
MGGDEKAQIWSAVFVIVADPLGRLKERGEDNY